MKKTLGFIRCLLAVFILWMVVSGFTVQTSAYIADDFWVSEDGSKITFTVCVGSSVGYVRGYKDEDNGNVHCLKFYSAWGGLNSSIGEKQEFVLQLSSEDAEIYVYHSDGEMPKKYTGKQI